MKHLDNDKTISILNDILEYELAGVVKYTHFALMVAGPNRLILDKFFKAQATESLQHAQQAGELLTGLSGHPTQTIPKINETKPTFSKKPSFRKFASRRKAISLYNQLLECSQGKSLYIEEYAREMIKTEEMHSIEIKKASKGL